jgi:paraquat-inducible protein A
MASTTNPGGAVIRTCGCCGRAHGVPAIPTGMRACCTRCGTGLVRRARLARSNSRTAAIATTALILYPFGVSLPMIGIERFGHHSEASILEGITTLFAGGHVWIGLVVLLCSIMLPLGKLAALLVLSGGGLRLGRRHRVMTYRLVEWTGRWGMLDVLLVAVLVAAVKLGDMVEVTAGPAALIFAACVMLSLIASACFDPHSLWDTQR